MKKFATFFIVIFIIGFAVFLSRDPGKSLSERAARHPSSVMGLSKQQDALDEITRIVVGINDRTKVVGAVKEIVEIAKRPEHNNHPGVQMYAALASIFPLFEGVIYRMRDIVEPSDWIHMTALFNLRTFAYNDYLYGPHMRAIFDFLTYPSEAVGPRFAKISNLQDFLMTSLAPRLEKLLEKARSFENLPNENFAFEFDRTIFVGEGNGIRFIDPEETKKHFIKPYHYTVTFLLQRLLMSTYYLSVLQLDELPALVSTIVKDTTINQLSHKFDLRPLGVDRAKGVTPKMVFDRVKKTREFLHYKETLSDGSKTYSAQEILDKVFSLAHQSAKYQKMAFICGIKYPFEMANNPEVNEKYCMSFSSGTSPESYLVSQGNKYLFNPNSMTINFKAKNNLFQQRLKVFDDNAKGSPSMITSDVTGKSIEINVKAIFQVKFNLRDTLPTGYEAPNDASFATPTGLFAWNYDHGKPSAFSDYSFNGFFNPARVHDIKSLYGAMTTVLYTDAVSPFAIFIRVPSPVRMIIPLNEIIGAND